MGKYLKVMVESSQFRGTKDYKFYEVPDDFDPDKDEQDNNELWSCIDDAVADYVETDYEILEGDWREDEDF